MNIFKMLPPYLQEIRLQGVRILYISLALVEQLDFFPVVIAVKC